MCSRTSGLNGTICELASAGAILNPWPCRCAMCNIMVRTIVERQESAANGEVKNGYTEAVRQTA